MGDLVAVFFIGILGVVHCAAMCGGLMTACAMRFGGRGVGPSLAFAFIYNADGSARKGPYEDRSLN